MIFFGKGPTKNPALPLHRVTSYARKYGMCQNDFSDFVDSVVTLEKNLENWQDFSLYSCGYFFTYSEKSKKKEWLKVY